MESVFKAAVEELNGDKPMVVATVVRTSGSTPQKSGAKLLVREDGSGVGTLGGGCVEGDIWFAAQELLKRGGDTELRDYQLNEDLAAQDGLVCGGTMYILIDPIRDADPYREFAAQAAGAYAGGSPMAIVNVTSAPAGSDVVVGAKMLVRENGETQGDLGDPVLEAMTVAKARDLMGDG